MKAIILAGGKGTRLWPLSREMTPKQVVDFGEGQSMLQKTLARLAKKIPSSEIVISTSEKLLERIESQIADFSNLGILVEPVNRNTAAAVCLTLKYLLEKQKVSEDEICLVCPSDLHFTHEENFLSLLPKAEDAAKKDCIVTFGIAPTFPETGYGYIQAEALHGEEILSVKKFIEKPDHKTAQKFLDAGNYFWNSGMFVFQIGHFLSEIQRIAPEFFEWMKASAYEECFQSFHTLPSISFDKAFMEKTDRISLIPYHSGWSDLGSWERLYHFFPKDEHENVTKGDVECIGTKNSLIFSGKRKVVAVGLDDLILVDTKDILLVTKKGEEISELAEKFSSHSQQNEDYLTENITLAPGETISEGSGHWIVVKGEAQCVLRQMHKVMKPNDTILIPQGEEVIFRNGSDLPTTLLHVEIRQLPKPKILKLLSIATHSLE